MKPIANFVLTVGFAILVGCGLIAFGIALGTNASRLDRTPAKVSTELDQAEAERERAWREYRAEKVRLEARYLSHKAEMMRASRKKVEEHERQRSSEVAE